MDCPGDSAGGLGRDLRALLEGDSQTGSCGGWEFDFPAGSRRDSETDLRRDSQRDLQGDFRCGFDRDLRATAKGPGLGSSDQSPVCGLRSMSMSRAPMTIQTRMTECP